MEKKGYLYILIFLSAVTTAIKVYNIFFAKLSEMVPIKTDNEEVKQLASEIKIVRERQYEIDTNIINKLIVTLLIITLLVTLYLSFKSEVKALASFTVYLVLSLIYHIHSWLMTRSIVHLYSDKEQRKLIISGSNYGFMFSIVVLIVYILIIVINYRSNQKKGVHHNASIGIDI